jgi:hypothetical protein
MFARAILKAFMATRVPDVWKKFRADGTGKMLPGDDWIHIPETFEDVFGYVEIAQLYQGSKRRRQR